MKSEILWENPSPDIPISSYMQITLSSTRYEYLEVEYRVATTSSGILFAKSKYGANIPLMAATYPSQYFFVGYRNMVSNGDGKYTIDPHFTGLRASDSDVKLLTDSTICIPVRIKGINDII